MSADSLETRDLTIRFGGHVAVDTVSCAFRPGELTAIVGPNGAGKTTYFNLISGQLARQRGGSCSTAAISRALTAPRAPAPGSAARSSSPICSRSLSVAENVRLAVQAGRRRALRHAAALDDAQPT